MRASLIVVHFEVRGEDEAYSVATAVGFETAGVGHAETLLVYVVA
jgi:hypothetical protein